MICPIHKTEMWSSSDGDHACQDLSCVHAHGFDYSVFTLLKPPMPTSLTIFPPHNYYDKEHLEDVVVKMKLLGPPRIRAVWHKKWNKCAWVALEGTHRLRAAKRLLMVPEIISIKYSDKKRVKDLDGIDLMYNATIAEYVKSVRSIPHVFQLGEDL